MRLRHICICFEESDFLAICFFLGTVIKLAWNVWQCAHLPFWWRGVCVEGGESETGWRGGRGRRREHMKCRDVQRKGNHIAQVSVGKRNNLASLGGVFCRTLPTEQQFQWREDHMCYKLNLRKQVDNSATGVDLIPTHWFAIHLFCCFTWFE